MLGFLGTRRVPRLLEGISRMGWGGPLWYLQGTGGGGNKVLVMCTDKVLTGRGVHTECRVKHTPPCGQQQGIQVLEVDYSGGRRSHYSTLFNP